MISVIIPYYNMPKTLPACLRSLADQKEKDFEIVIVNDCSSSPLKSLTNDFQKIWPGRLQTLNNQSNHGAPYARNKGFRAARGELVIFIDADIILRPDMLAVLRQALDGHPEAAYAYSSFYWGWKKFPSFPFSVKRLKKMPYIHTAALIRRDAFLGFDERVKRLQDWDLWLSMLEHGQTGVYVPEYLFTVRPGGTMSRWLPSFAYRWLPFLPLVKQYRSAQAYIKAKHKL
ncbi:hypothetical protein COX69_03385 [Candidatus Falkowbacteria bacterium CG_4_10_14_0_2_um_filter_48_10]|uniref:Glycosyltransferase 2-like domain-containing protein n=1 Tax=Candidatus Falkowbacteria bacterium CG23_combo_of_CG06-09_8_20_14_all_49_15 TaxID=1974572 RepID=A0A2G9ZKH0_9BACT|nr:MAG: hypothetical protein COX22_03205 [Candidatus Falkowbacteria bacterium CG23_combo_of_CG06-09_8_20_14_all_49_15]PJA07959.1 MAG: hypothetical protein COX69_03385 [Candidatus Falkowbacteria bacterium CG_4_10_14_0_2_um_filter_48_10]